MPWHAPSVPAGHTYREIEYTEQAGVGYLHFDFYNGAMSTDQCRRLHEAYLYARSRRETKVITLMGGDDFFSNGIHLDVIEAADDPADESWRNLHAINDIVREIVETDSHIVISALAGDAAAGGVLSRSRPTECWRARTWCSIRTTGTWAACTAPSTGPTCCRVASGSR